MEIGVLTFHDTNNFGSLVQTYGLYKKLIDMGYDCEIIDYQCDSIIRREMPEHFRFSLSIKHLLHDFFNGRHQRKKYAELRKFMCEKMILSKRCDRSNVAEITKKYDTLMIGSDIVWGLDITAGDLTYFLDFATERHCKKISYAASIGNPWNENEKKQVAPLLQKFNHIAVRENESAEWVKDASGCDASVVCDPTMLLTAEEWRKIAGVKTKQNKDYILVYFTKGDCLKSAIAYSQKAGLKLKVIGYGVSRTKDYKYVSPHSLGEFLSLIDNAAIVFTASYHGFLFSTYFNRPFVYFNISHPSRMTTIARRLGVDHLDATHQMPVSITCDYTEVNRNLQAYREQSVNLLRKMLEP